MDYSWSIKDTVLNYRKINYRLIEKDVKQSGQDEYAVQLMAEPCACVSCPFP
jgi:hypothetical protein